MTQKRKNNTEEPKKSSYTIQDALKIADEILKLSRDKKYNLGAFIHGLIFASEYVQFGYRIPPKQVADIRRGCRKYFQELQNVKTQKQ